MNVTYLKDRNQKPSFVKKTCQFYEPDLGSQLIAVLERELSEPLDFIDADEATKQRMREVY